MLSLLPALLILAFQGPTALERMGHREGRLPEALRALERAFSSPQSPIEASSDARSMGEQRAKEAFVRLAALTSDAAFFAAVAELFGETDSIFEDTGIPCPVLEDREPSRLAPIPESELGSLSSGYAKGRRTRDGPRV